MKESKNKQQCLKGLSGQPEHRRDTKSHGDGLEYNGAKIPNNHDIDTQSDQMFQQYSKTDIQKHDSPKCTTVDATCYAVIIGFVLVFFLTCLDTCSGKVPAVLEDNDYGYYMMTKNNISDTIMQNTKYKTEKTAQFYDAYNRTRAMGYKLMATNTR